MTPREFVDYPRIEHRQRRFGDGGESTPRLLRRADRAQHLDACAKGLLARPDPHIVQQVFVIRVTAQPGDQFAGQHLSARQRLEEGAVEERIQRLRLPAQMRSQPGRGGADLDD